MPCYISISVLKYLFINKNIDRDIGFEQHNKPINEIHSIIDLFVYKAVVKWQYRW